MDIRSALLAEHSKKTKERIVNYVGGDAARFRELLKCATAGDRRLAECAAWPLGELLISFPAHLKKSWPAIIRLITATDQHPAVYRNLLRALQYVDVPEQHAGEIIGLCFGFIRSEQIPVAVRANAISVAARLCEPYPELGRELSLLLEDLERFSVRAALKVRIRDVRRWLSDIARQPW